MSTISNNKISPQNITLHGYELSRNPDFPSIQRSHTLNLHQKHNTRIQTSKPTPHLHHELKSFTSQHPPRQGFTSERQASPSRYDLHHENQQKSSIRKRTTATATIKRQTARNLIVLSSPFRNTRMTISRP